MTHTPESKEKIRQALLGVPLSVERRQKISDVLQERLAVSGPWGYDIGSHTRGKASPRAVLVGSTRIGNGHMQIKCGDGMWRYRARVMWEEANGPIPPERLIHHRNLDPFDDRLENFQIVTRSEHMRIHGTSDEMRRRGAKGLASRYGPK
jgi:hypothetical protein